MTFVLLAGLGLVIYFTFNSKNGIVHRIKVVYPPNWQQLLEEKVRPEERSTLIRAAADDLGFRLTPADICAIPAYVRRKLQGRVGAVQGTVGLREQVHGGVCAALPGRG